MKLLEYEAKSLLARADIAVPEGAVVSSTHDSNGLTVPVVLKSQVPTGGRGKAGGIQIVESAAALTKTVDDLLHKPIYGHTPTVLLAEQKLSIVRELYLAFVIDRTAQQIAILASAHGGIEVEENSQHITKIPITHLPEKHDIDQLVATYKLSGAQSRQLEKLVYQLWHVFRQQDALLLEINPLVVTQQGDIICADAKIELDDTAAFRHRDWHFQQPVQSSQFVVLDSSGTVACMANGAGLAMATVDAIKAAGATPANFLDIGGGTNTEGMVAAFRDIQALPKVKAIVVNVFAGITRCDEVAQAVIAAKSMMHSLPPLFIRLSGTNELVGKQLLHEHRIATLPSLQACVDQAVQEASHV